MCVTQVSFVSLKLKAVQFDLDKLSHHRSILDDGLLRFFNRQALRKLDEQTLQEKAMPLFRLRFRDR